MKYRTALLLGAPGSGKGTQGKVLGSIPRFFHCACGDVFRNLKLDSPLGKIFTEHSKRGQLVPDKHTMELWHNFIDASIQIGRFSPETDTLILDGIPRNVHQAEILKDSLDVVGVFYLLNKDEESLIHRIQRRALKENRVDDANVDVIRERIAVYERETKPVVNFYGPEVVRTIDADQTPAEVLLDILTYLVRK